MINPRSPEEKIIKDIRNLFRLKNEQNHTAIEDIRNLFRLKNEQNHTAIEDIRNLFRLKKNVKEIKDIVLRNIKNLFE